MNAAECGDLLALMAQYDYRTVDEQGVMAWLLQVQGVEFADGFRVVADWYGSSRERIMPADVLAGRTELHRQRLAAAPASALTPGPEWLADDPGYRAELARLRALAMAAPVEDVRAAAAWQAIQHQHDGPAAVEGGGAR